MTIVEIDPGANGWWTGILSPYARATGGRYVAALMVDAGVTGADSFEAVRTAFFKGVVDKAIFGGAEAVDFGPNHMDAIPAGSANFVLVARAFHNWAREGDATDAYLAAFFRMLKPGGILAVEQHRAAEGADPRAGTGYVPESYVIDAARKAGFTFEARSEINANPKDTKDHPFGVWTLPTHAPQRAGRPARRSELRSHEVRRDRRVRPDDAQISEAGLIPNVAMGGEGYFTLALESRLSRRLRSFPRRPL